MEIKFNRYWICDRSGIGHMKWKYFAGDFEGDLSYARDVIIERHESWALYAESYSLDIELDVEAPIEVLEAELKKFSDSAEYYAEARAALTKMISAKENA